MNFEGRKESLNYKFFLEDLDYKNRTNFIKYIDQAQNFYNGDQYPNENFNNMVRVTMNICSFASNIIASKIVGTPQYIRFTSDNENVDCTALQRFDEYNLSKLNEKTENFQTALDSLNNGTAVVYYRWDEDDTTYKGIYKGGLVLEQIEIRNFAVANPYLKEIQKQKWVMFWHNEDVKAVREKVERSSKKERKRIQDLIKPDNTSRDTTFTDEVEEVTHGLVCLYTRFFRIEGEVFFMCSTKEYDIFEYPHALNPNINKSIVRKLHEKVDKQRSESDKDTLLDDDKISDEVIDYQDMIMQIVKPKQINNSDYKKIKEKFSLYPFARYTPYEINNSFYGRSHLKGLISIQKGINFALSMQLKCIENNAYNKIFAKDGALQGQVITNEPSQVITDYSKFTNGWGIKFAESQPMPNGLSDTVDRITAMTRVFYGFNDVMDGSITNQDISGYAMQQMIKQANTSVEQQQQLFWKFIKDKAAIRLMFYKFYVDEAKYTYELEDFEVDKEESARQQLLYAQSNDQLSDEAKNLDFSKSTHKVQIRNIRGRDLYGTNFDINIDVMQGLVDSKLSEAQMWDTLILNGGIQNLQPDMLEMYIQANPTVSEHTKHALKNTVSKLKMSETTKLKEENEQLLKYVGQLQEAVKVLQSQNKYATSYIQNLSKEFKDRINVANQINKTQMSPITTNSEPVSEGEGKSLNSRGVDGTNIQ